MRTDHQQRIDEFMRLAGQAVPERPVMPSEDVRTLRAKLILEEAFETIQEGLGLIVRLGSEYRASTFIEPSMMELDAAQCLPNMELLADGCADLSVVTIGTLSACGISDGELLAEVDAANLRKFGPGGHRRADGKWVKPPDFVPPDVIAILKQQGWEP